MCNRIGNSNRTGTEPEPNRIGVILAGTGLVYKPENLAGFKKNFNTQLTSHNGSNVVESKDFVDTKQYNKILVDFNRHVPVSFTQDSFVL